MSFTQDSSRFICFIGLDGSGKTTHALALNQILANMEIKSIHISPRSSLIRLLLPKKIRLLMKKIYVRPRKLALGNSRIFRKGLFIHFLSIPIFIYSLLTYYVIIKPLMRKYVVVCDRYFYDLFLNIFGKRALLLVELLPKPNITILLDLPVGQAYSRMHDIKDKYIPQHFYIQLRRWYFSLAKQYDFLIIDSTPDFETVQNDIIAHII